MTCHHLRGTLWWIFNSKSLPSLLPGEEEVQNGSFGNPEWSRSGNTDMVGFFYELIFEAEDILSADRLQGMRVAWLGFVAPVPWGIQPRSLSLSLSDRFRNKKQRRVIIWNSLAGRAPGYSYPTSRLEGTGSLDRYAFGRRRFSSLLEDFCWFITLHSKKWN